ncbi:MAG: ShlB/FhaC/HecB family hemolysin secretion/activation protein [Acidiferrobacterales bacterium]
MPPPEFKPPEVPELVLPPIPPPPPARLPFVIRVFVREFRITGNTVFTTDELKKVTAPFENREITNNDLEELRHQLTLYYVNRGYINSGAVIPDQKVEDGVIKIQIIEGRLTRIDIEGTRKFGPEYFSSRLQLQAGPPLNVKNLEQELQILLQNPLIESINAQLAPGDRPGEAVVKTRVSEAPPWDFGAVLDNKLSPSLGEARLVLFGDLRNLAGRGDTFSGELTWAEGIDLDDNYKLRYRLPLTVKDTALTLYYEKGDAVVIEEPFSALDIRTKVETFGVRAGHPFIRTPNKQFTLAAALERRKSETFLMGIPFSFSPGVVNGESVVSVLRLVQDWLSRGRNQVFSARSTFSFGLDAFDSTVDTGRLPDSEFVSWLGQLQWARRFGTRGHQLSVRFDGQLSDDPLLPIEQFSVGGLDSVRGYRTNQLVRDEGWSASLQYQVPVFRNPTGSRNLQFAAFADAGAARNKEGLNLSPSDLVSYGVGLIWNPSPKLSAELYFAKALDDVPSGGEHSLQDDGINFRLIGRPFALR